MFHAFSPHHDGFAHHYGPGNAPQLDTIIGHTGRYAHSYTPPHGASLPLFDDTV